MTVTKVTNLTVTPELLAERIERAKGYPKAQWIRFCENMMEKGYTVELYEARMTVSKYLTIWNCGKSFRVRYSNHKPIRDRDHAKDCDFFVGVCNQITTNTEQAIRATIEALGPALLKGVS